MERVSQRTGLNHAGHSRLRLILGFAGFRVTDRRACVFREFRSICSITSSNVYPSRLSSSSTRATVFATSARCQSMKASSVLKRTILPSMKAQGFLPRIRMGLVSGCRLISRRVLAAMRVLVQFFVGLSGAEVLASDAIEEEVNHGRRKQRQHLRNDEAAYDRDA